MELWAAWQHELTALVIHQFVCLVSLLWPLRRGPPLLRPNGHLVSALPGVLAIAADKTCR